MEYYIPVARQQQEIQNPLDNYARIMQIQGAQNQNQLAQYALSKAQREDQEQAAYNNYLASIDMSSPNALQQALPGMYKVAPKQAFALQKTIQEQTKSAADLEKVKAETVAKKLDYLKESFVPVNDQNTYESWLQRIAKDSPDIVATLPQKFSPEFKIDFMSKAEERAKQLYERANPKLHFSDVGGSIVGQNPFTAAAVGQSISKTATPGEMLTDWRAKNLPQQYGETLSTPVAAYNALAAQGVGGAPVAPANTLVRKPTPADFPRVTPAMQSGRDADRLAIIQQEIATQDAVLANPVSLPADRAKAINNKQQLEKELGFMKPSAQAAPAMQAPAKAGGIPGIRLDSGADKAGDKIKAEAKAKAEVELPKSIDTAMRAIKSVDEILKHPGFESAVGATPWIGARFIEGSDTADFMRRLEQIKGGAFLEAYNTLKGGGQITEVEGAKATAAINRMDKSQSEKEFISAANDFKDAIREGVSKMALAAGKPLPEGLRPTASQSASGVISAPVKVNSAAELAKLPSGTTYQAPDGSIRTKR